MFADFLRRLANPSAPLPRFDARLALAALLVRVARADGSYDSREQALIDHVLQAHHALTLPQAQTLRTEAEALESEAPDTVRFTREIKDAVPHEEREWVIEALWQVVLSDGRREHEEDTLMRLVANLLGINDRDCALARQRVEARRSL
jgi:uncharacterized tellurite resistance protein B-like protein